MYKRQIEFDRCSSCAGLWFDIMEEEQLKKLAGSEQVDVGDEKVGQALNEKGRIKCPKDSTPMVRMVVAGPAAHLVRVVFGVPGDLLRRGRVQGLQGRNVCRLGEGVFQPGAQLSGAGATAEANGLRVVADGLATAVFAPIRSKSTTPNAPPT